MTAPVAITVNGTEHRFGAVLTVAELLDHLDLPRQGVAIAVDGAILPKSRWDTVIAPGWQIEVVTAVQGG